VLRQHRLLIVGFTLVFTIGSYLIWSSKDPIYRAEAKIACQDPILDENVLGGDAIATRPPAVELALCATAVTGREVAREVRKELGDEGVVSLDVIRDSVSTQNEASTSLIVIATQSRNASFAAALANTFAEKTVEVRTDEARKRLARAARTLRRRFERQRTARSTPIIRAAFEERLARIQSLRDFSTPVSVAEPAETSDDPISPNVVRDTLLGALLGLTLGIVAAFIRDSLDVRLRGAQQIQSELDLPMLAALSESALGRAGPFDPKSKKLSDSDLEAFRILRRNLELLAGQSVRSVAVTSAAAEEGKSTVAAGLAWAYVNAGQRTLLIDCDLRRSRLAERLGVPASPGLTDYLAEQAAIGDIMHAVPLDRGTANGAGNGTPETHALTFVPAGSLPSGPSELLGSSGFKDFLAVASRSYDRVVLDTSPVLPVADTLEVLGLVESVVICVRASRTTRDQASAAKAILSHFPGKGVGLVVTSAETGQYPVYGYAATTQSS
jgi:capsular exopolysaccharide synthesis family protein